MNRRAPSTYPSQSFRRLTGGDGSRTIFVIRPGFIDRATDLAAFCKCHALRTFVIDDAMCEGQTSCRRCVEQTEA